MGFDVQRGGGGRTIQGCPKGGRGLFSISSVGGGGGGMDLFWNDPMRKMCTLITSKGTDIDENIANQNHATRTRTPKPGYLNLSIIYSHDKLQCFYRESSMFDDHLMVSIRSANQLGAG